MKTFKAILGEFQPEIEGGFDRRVVNAVLESPNSYSEETLLAAIRAKTRTIMDRDAMRCRANEALMREAIMSAIADPSPDLDVDREIENIRRDHQNLESRAVVASAEMNHPVPQERDAHLPVVPDPALDAAREMANIRREHTDREDARRYAEMLANDAASYANMANQPTKPHAAVGQETERHAEALKLGTKLADLVTHSVDGKITSEMRSLASGVRSALGVGSAESRPGRAFVADLVPGGLYIARGWASGNFDWTYIGPVPGDPDRMTIQRDGAGVSVELVGDHGLAPYDTSSQGKFWHPTNWTEGTGIGVGTGKMTSDAAARAGLSMELPQEEEDEFP